MQIEVQEFPSFWNDLSKHYASNVLLLQFTSYAR